MGCRGGCVQRHLKKENHPTNGQNCKNRRPQESNGHDEVDGLSQVQQPTRIVKRVKDRERGIPGGVYISCSVCDFYEKL